MYIFFLRRKKGFSVGDELGLEESLGNLDGNKRRSISNTEALIATNSVGTLPAAKLPVSQIDIFRVIAILGRYSAEIWIIFIIEVSLKFAQ